MRIPILTAVAAVVLAAAPAARAGVRWTLDFQLGRTGSVVAKGAEGNGTYGYLTFTVTNKTAAEAPVNLSVWAETDVVNRKYRGSMDSIVQAAVQRQTGKVYKSLSEARGPLAAGAAVDVLVTLGKLDPNVDRLDIHVLGLVDRVYGDKGRTLIEDRVLVVTARRQGDEYRRQDDLFRVEGRRWTLLAPVKELRKI